MTTATDPNLRAEQQEIDSSTKWPVLMFFLAALQWLLLGGVLQALASIQLHSPSFLADCEWFTHGRLAPAAQNALIYGWGMNAGLAFALWLMARLSAATLRHGGWLFVGGSFWNFGVLLGVLGILGGYSTSHELLEMPRFVSLVLLGSYLLIGVWAITTFSVRNTEAVYASQWYLFGAAVWFPWLYLAARAMLFVAPVHGTVQSVLETWYANGLYHLWFVQLALAAIYYFLPKMLGKPIYDYYLAPVGFWWFAVCAAFAGGSRLIGGPVPAWVSTLGSVAYLMLIPALIIIAVNIFGTLAGRYGDLRTSNVLRFIFVSILGLVLAAGLGFAFSQRGLAAKYQFTLLAQLQDWTVFYTCFSTAMFGAAYFILPRVTGKGWRSNALIGIHFAATVIGIVLMLASGVIGGAIQGGLLATAGASFVDIGNAVSPYLVTKSVAILVLLGGHAAFLLNFVWIACPLNSRGTAPAVIRNPAPIRDTSHAVGGQA